MTPRPDGVLQGPAHQAVVLHAGPSSVKSRTPSSAISPSGASCSPARPTVIAPDGAHVAQRRAPELEHLAHDAGAVDGRVGVGHGDDCT